MNFFEKAQARAHALDILGLTGHPNQDEIRSAFKRLAFETHPDRTEGVDDRFIEVQAAYSLLKNDEGYSETDRLRPAPEDTAATTVHTTTDRTGGHVAAKEPEIDDGASSPFISPRRVRSGITSRIIKINQSEASECRSLLDEIPHMAEPDQDEISLRASILNVIEQTDAPHVPHTNHLPYAIRKTGRRISYMVKQPICEGANRVAVPTGTYTDRRKVLPIIVRFKTNKGGTGTHTVSASTLAESFPGARSVRIHFGLDEWPEAEGEAVAA